MGKPIKKFIETIITFFIGQQSRKQFVRYLLVGFSSFFLEYTLFFCMFQLMSLHELVSNTIAITVVFFFNFLLNRLWTFKSKLKFHKQMFMYLGLFLFNTLISNLFIYTMTNYTQLSPLLSKVVIMGVIVLWNFVIYKKVIYKT